MTVMVDALTYVLCDRVCECVDFVSICILCTGSRKREIDDDMLYSISNINVAAIFRISPQKFDGVCRVSEQNK